MNSKSFGTTLGNAAAAGIDLVDSIATGTGTAVTDFIDGLSVGFSARRAKATATCEVPSARKERLTSMVILLKV